MALTTSAILIQPTLDNVNALITVEDLTDYVGNGINLGTTQVSGYLRITLNSSTGTSVIYDNFGGVTPDIDYNNSPISSSTINLPVDANGYALQGTYTIDYNVAVDLIIFPNSPLYNLTKTFTYLLQQDKPVVCLAADVNCAGSSITSYDTTVYGTYSIVSRVHTLFPPPASSYSPIVGSLATLSSGTPIVDMTWTQEVQSTVTYTYPSGLIFIVYVEGVREIPVVCDLGMSKIFCCLKKVFDRYNTLQTRNITAADAMFEDTVKPMLEAMVMYNAAVVAGNPNSASFYYNQTIQVSGCGEDCGCTGSAPQVINPSAGAGNIVIVESPDNSISVNPVIVGNTTTYEVQVSGAIQNALSVLKNTNITTATPSTLAITSNTVGNTKTYTINYVAPPSLNISIWRLRIQNLSVGANPYMSFFQYNVISNGSNFIPVGSAVFLLGSGVLNVATDYAEVVVPMGGLVSLAGAPYNFTVSAEIQGTGTTGVVGGLYNLEVQVYSKDNVAGSFTLRFVNPITGIPYTLQGLNSLATFSNSYIELAITYIYN